MQVDKRFCYFLVGEMLEYLPHQAELCRRRDILRDVLAFEVDPGIPHTCLKVFNQFRHDVNACVPYTGAFYNSLPNRKIAATS